MVPDIFNGNGECHAGLHDLNDLYAKVNVFHFGTILIYDLSSIVTFALAHTF